MNSQLKLPRTHEFGAFKESIRLLISDNKQCESLKCHAVILLSIFGTVLSKYQILSCVCNLSVYLRACQTKHKTCKTCGCERGFCVYTLPLCWCHNKTLGGQDISKYGVIRKCLSLARHSRKMFIMKAFCSQ